MADPAFRPAIATGLAAFSLGIGFLVFDPGGLARALREAAFDLVEAHVPARRQPGGVVVVDIDRASLAAKGAWPWRRAALADLLAKLQQAHPSVIGIDILLDGPDRRAPAPLLRMLARTTGRSDLDAVADSLPDDDKYLGEVIARSDVVLGLLLDQDGKDAAPFAAPILSMGGVPAQRPLSQEADGIDAPLPGLVDGAVAVGALSLSAGPGGARVRSVPVFVRGGREIYAGFAMEVFRDAEQASAFVLERGGETVSVGDRAVPLREGASMRLHFTPPASWAARTLPASDVLDGKVAPDRLRGRIVLVGTSAPEAGALLATAADPLTPTVQVHAEAIEGLRSGDLPQRIPHPAIAEPLAAAALGLAALGAALWLGPLLAIAALLGLVLAWAGLSVGLFAGAGLLADPVGPLIPAVAAANAALVVMFARTRKLRHAIERKFGRYLSPEIVRRLAAAPEELKIEGELREVTALFSDIEGFTTMSESAEPRTLVGALDAYFEGVCAIVIRHGGMVDKIVGDAVHGLFNAPLDLAGHARAALDCAVEIGRFTAEFRLREDARALGFGRTRIGFETGPVIVGDVGGLGHLDYTAHGDAVNSAARLEAINKQFGTTICLGARAAAAIGDQERLRPLGTVTLRGRAAGTAVFSPWPDDATAERRSLYHAAYAAMAEDRTRALCLFRDLACRWPEDPATAYWVRTLGTAEPPR
ncbi:CHASE2 domain-containing protein [Labrys monachus]|uniref:Adenylate cyclase n=1 Tax=Labrys monachus TaxID=217067 RepID=A0ABU0FP12_9HYPH|nr:adenylate/guanylate cyclase domain-containing protein [Labrys monachus]MDQ0396350.1 adenylate cyclase [Labrys monachus]